MSQDFKIDGITGDDLLKKNSPLLFFVLLRKKESGLWHFADSVLPYNFTGKLQRPNLNLSQTKNSWKIVLPLIQFWLFINKPAIRLQNSHIWGWWRGLSNIKSSRHDKFKVATLAENSHIWQPWNQSTFISDVNMFSHTSKNVFLWVCQSLKILAAYSFIRPILLDLGIFAQLTGRYDFMDSATISVQPALNSPAL